MVTPRATYQKDTEDAIPEDDRARRRPSAVARWLRTRAAWVFLLNVALIVLFSAITEDHVFWSVANLRALLIALSEGLLLALALSMLLGAGIFDLSLGANLVLSSVMGAKVIQLFQSSPGDATAYSDPAIAIAAGLAVCVATGAIFGLINGLLIAVAEVNSLIATLATLGIATGAGYLVTGGSDIASMPQVMQSSIGLNAIGGVVPLPAIIALLVLAILWVIVRYTRYGLRIQAIGSSRTAAERAGIRVRAYMISLTVLAGVMASLAGFIDLAKFSSTSLSGHGSDALNAVTAAVIGGTLLEGGSIAIIGTLWGAALAVILQAGLVLSGVSSFWQLIAVGVVLLLAVVLDRVAMKRRERAR